MPTARTVRSVTAILFALSLTACGSGGGGDDDDDAPKPPPTEEPAPNPDPKPDPDPDPKPGDEQVIEGAIVVPDGAQANDPAAKAKMKVALLQTSAQVTASATCEGVPTGYVPVANATISFATDDNQPSGVTAQTDACGAFSATVPGDISYATATAAGYKAITVPVTTFTQDSGDKPATLSVLPDLPDAGYEIASLQWTDSKLYFTVVDTITNKAVLGVPSTSITYTVNGGKASDLKSLNYAASQVDGNASVALALDASGSMYSGIYDSSFNPVLDENGERLTAMRMTARAAHTFLDGKNATDEVGFDIFDHRSLWIDKAFWETQNLVTGPKDAAQPYQPVYDDAGFNADVDASRLAVDFYNNASALWFNYYGSPDPLHSSLPDTLRVNGNFYPWGGGTTAYDAAEMARQKVEARSNARKIVVLMSDGMDGGSSETPDSLIAKFKQSNIPLWTVAFGSSVSEEILKRLADETGGHYISSIDQSQLQSEFAAMQTGIVFQYIGELNQSSLPADAELNVNLDFGSLTAERSLVVQ